MTTATMSVKLQRAAALYVWSVKLQKEIDVKLSLTSVRSTILIFLPLSDRVTQWPCKQSVAQFECVRICVYTLTSSKEVK